MPITTNTLIITLIVTIVIIAIWNIRLERRISKLLKGKGSVSIEDSIIEIGKHIELLEKNKEEVASFLNDADKRIRRSVQAVETIRFNPFKGTGAGGNQSFASALVNENGDGIVISSLYSRDRVSIFAKSIKSLNSDFELSEEEKEVLKKASEKTR